MPAYVKVVIGLPEQHSLRARRNRDAEGVNARRTGQTHAVDMRTPPRADLHQTSQRKKAARGQHLLTGAGLSNGVESSAGGNERELQKY